jgi:D-sedoheptulose 7-phosphate isomerase
VEALVTDKDVVVGISTGGNSKNVVRGIEQATKQGAKTVGLLGKGGGLLAKMVDIPLVVPSNSTQRIQEAHITVGHIVFTLVEHALFECGTERR